MVTADHHEEGEDAQTAGSSELVTADLDLAALQKADDDRLTLAEKNKRMQQQLRVRQKSIVCCTVMHRSFMAFATVLHEFAQKNFG